MMNNRYSQAARAIATKFKTETAIVVDVSTPVKDSYIFHVMMYLNRYFGKYWIKYFDDGTAIIQKQG